MQIKQKNAFSLIEIVIVVVLIATLTGSALIGYNSYMKNARDNRRQIDLQSLSQAVTQYKQQTGQYPDELEDLTDETETGEVILPELPSDPKSSQDGFLYEYSSNGSSYQLSAKLENGNYYVITPFGPEQTDMPPDYLPIPTPT